MKKVVFLIAGLLALTSCETPVDLDLKQSAPQLAVEAVVTDQPALNFVKLTLSAPYAKEERPQAVIDARVSITDNTGNSILFEHEANGIYKPAAEYKGVIGRTYTLMIQAKGQTYMATSVLNAVPILDKVDYEYVDGKNDSYGREEGYYLKASFQDIAGVRNFYKVDILVNGQIKHHELDDILLTEDKLYDGAYLNDLKIFKAFDKNDKLEVRLLSLTKEGYEFYRALSDLANQGGLLGKNPSNLPTNVSNGAVGFFSASAASAKVLALQ